MIITCKKCATRYYLAGERVQPMGSKVRCSNCNHVFETHSSMTNGADGLALSESDEAHHGLVDADIQFDEPLTGASVTMKDSNLGKRGEKAIEDSELPELADELDKIFGPDEANDDLFSQGDEASVEPLVVNDDDEMEAVELSDLDTPLDETLESETAGSPGSGQEPRADDFDNIDVLDLSTLGEEIDELAEKGGLQDEVGDNDADKVEGLSLVEIDDKPDGEDENIEPPASEVEADDETDLENVSLLNELDDQMDDLFETDSGALDDQTEALKEDTSSPEESIGLDTIQIEDFESELDNLEDLSPDETGSEPTKDELSMKEMSDQDEDFSLDTMQIESFEQDLENLDDLTSPEDETPPEEAAEQDEEFSLDTKQIESFDLDLENLEDLTSPDDEVPPEETAEQEEEFNLDTKQIESLDLNLDNLDGIELDIDEDGPTEGSEKDQHFVLDTNQIESLDLDLEDLDELNLDEDDDGLQESSELDDSFVLDTMQIESLDLDLEDLDASDDDADVTDPEADEDIDIMLDEDQINSLNLELESTDNSDTPEAVTDDGKSADSSASEPDTPLDTDRKKKAEVLNLDLERPDLDNDFDLEEEIDLPILDELLAPAEVTDDTLMDDSAEDNADLTPDGGIDLSDDVGEAASEDDQFLLDLEDLDQKIDEPEKDAQPEEALSLSLDDIEVEPEIEIPEPEEVKVEAEPAAIAAERAVTSGQFETIPDKRTSKSLMLLLIAVLLLALLFGLSAMGIKVPYLSNLNIPFLNVGSQQMTDDIGNVRIKTADINSKFVTNKKSGRLFVVTGEVLNQYDNTRGRIQIKGNIYGKGGKVVATETVQCGSFLSDTDLTTKAFSDIKGFLTNKKGSGGPGPQQVGPGKTLPFMIVFAELPPDIEEFSVEVISSAALK